MEKDTFSEKFDKYKVALILAVVVMDILLAAIFFTGNDEKEVQPPAEVQQTAEQVTVPLQAPPKPKVENKVDAKGGYGIGQYKVGVDIPAGEYLALGEGYLEITRNPNRDIINNDNFKNCRYIEARDGEYLRTQGLVTFYPVNKAPKLEISPENIPEGHYKVGKDIPAGEYKIHSQPNGYFAVLKNSHTYDFIANGFIPSAETRYVKVDNGQYFQLKNATAELVK